MGQPIHGKTIDNGAMDDASGVASVLETAKAFAAAANAGHRPKRSLLFVVFTAEEKGLLGSRFFAGHTRPGPEDRIAADLNLDMFVPTFAATAQFESFFADLARAVADVPARPHHVPSSFFRRLEAPSGRFRTARPSPRPRSTSPSARPARPSG